MSEAGAPHRHSSAIGEVAAPPFARLPDPSTLFLRRAARLREVAQDHRLGPYLECLAGIADVQHAIQDGLPPPDMPDEEARERARQFNMPPLDRSRFVADDPAFEATLARLLARADGLALPDTARAALASVRAAGPAARAQMARAVLADSIPVEHLAGHVFIAAALQVHLARIAARLDAERLVPVGDALCPVCGGAPLASVIVAWPAAANTRFCACSLCETWWHYVRIRCAVCGSTKGIGYKALEGADLPVQAETCEECRGYVKILHQHKDPALEPVADDVATLVLDLLVQGEGYRRGAFNPYLLGY